MYVSLQLFPVLDVLSISATETDETQITAHLPLTDSWTKSLEILKRFLEKELELNGTCGIYLTECLSSSRGDCLSSSIESSSTAQSSRSSAERSSGFTGESSTSVSEISRALPRISGVMSRLVSVADRDQIKSVFETLHSEVCRPVYVCVCLSE